MLYLDDEGSRDSRVGVLREAGNAIVPECAAEFIRAYLDVRDAA